MIVDNLFTQMGSEIKEGKEFVYFSVIESANNYKVGNSGERSATADGMRALMTIIYAVPNMPNTFLRAGNMMVNESKLLPLWTLHFSRSRQP